MRGKWKVLTTIQFLFPSPPLALLSVGKREGGSSLLPPSPPLAKRPSHLHPILRTPLMALYGWRKRESNEERRWLPLPSSFPLRAPFSLSKVSSRSCFLPPLLGLVPSEESYSSPANSIRGLHLLAWPVSFFRKRFGQCPFIQTFSSSSWAPSFFLSREVFFLLPPSHSGRVGGKEVSLEALLHILVRTYSGRRSSTGQARSSGEKAMFARAPEPLYCRGQKATKADKYGWKRSEGCGLVPCTQRNASQASIR